jgi:hypothetical protein
VISNPATANFPPGTVIVPISLGIDILLYKADHPIDPLHVLLAQEFLGLRKINGKDEFFDLKGPDGSYSIPHNPEPHLPRSQPPIPVWQAGAAPAL